jgi:hypothetical protein
MNVEDQKGFGVSEAMESLARGKSWMLEDDDYETLQWFEEDTNPPTFEEIQHEITRLHNEYDQKVIEQEQELENAKNARESAIQKLSALGLNEEELKAIIGL